MTVLLKPATQERLLDLAHDLVKELKEARIYLVADDRKGEVDSLGVPASCVGHVCSFLYKERNIDHFKAFVERLDHLDSIAGQNVENPRAQHAALKRVLLPWLEHHNDLLADEHLYVLSWVRRLLPKDSKAVRPPNGRGTTRNDRARSVPQEAARGSQLEKAFAQARAQKKKAR